MSGDDNGSGEQNMTFQAEKRREEKSYDLMW